MTAAVDCSKGHFVHELMHLQSVCLLQWGEQDNYEVVRKVGRGKYSEVFEVSSSAAALQQQHGKSTTQQPACNRSQDSSCSSATMICV
jgi:hypothetical protein